MPFFTDQLNRVIELPATPKRIVSLVPSQTELLFDLGLEKEVVGITKFCVHPQSWFREKTRIGGTKNVDLDKIVPLQPDLIITNKEENMQAQVEALAERFPVWVSDVNTLDDAYEMIESIGTITGKKAVAQTIITNIQNRFSQLQTPDAKPQTAYLIWREPYMTIGGDTFIHHMLEAAGFKNIFFHRQRYPSVTIEELQVANCRYLLLSSEPYPFRQKHVEELSQLLPNTQILLVDGEMFSWYGSRLLKAPGYFRDLQQQMRTMV